MPEIPSPFMRSMSYPGAEPEPKKRRIYARDRVKWSERGDQLEGTVVQILGTNVMVEADGRGQQIVPLDVLEKIPRRYASWNVPPAEQDDGLVAAMAMSERARRELEDIVGEDPEAFRKTAEAEAEYAKASLMESWSCLAFLVAAAKVRGYGYDPDTVRYLLPVAETARKHQGLSEYAPSIEKALSLAATRNVEDGWGLRVSRACLSIEENEILLEDALRRVVAHDMWKTMQDGRHVALVASVIAEAWNASKADMEKTAAVADDGSIPGPYSRINLPMAERVIPWELIESGLGGRQKEIRDLPRYNPHYHPYGFYFTWWEPRHTPYPWARVQEETAYVMRQPLMN